MFSENSLSRRKDNNAYFRSSTHTLSITSPPPAFIELILLILPNLGKDYHNHYHHRYHTPPHHDPLVLAFLFLPPACLPSDFFTDYFPSITSSPSSSPPAITSSPSSPPTISRNSIKAKFSSAVEKYHSDFHLHLG